MVMLLHIYLDIFCFNSVSEHFTKNISMLAHQKCKNRHTVFTKVMGVVNLMLSEKYPE